MFKEKLIYHVIKYLRYENQVNKILSDSLLLQDSCDLDKVFGIIFLAAEAN